MNVQILVQPNREVVASIRLNNYFTHAKETMRPKQFVAGRTACPGLRLSVMWQTRNGLPEAGEMGSFSSIQ